MIKLTIQVSNISVVISLYDKIYIYTSDTENGTYTFLDSILLVAGVSTYTYNHTAGTTGTWYRSSFFNTTTSAESALSNATHGTAPALFHGITYPEEFDFTATEDTIILKMRQLIGGIKGLGRLYIDGTTDTECESAAILDDDKTIDLDEKGWPLFITVNGTEFTTLDNPVVNGYQYLTFSGTLASTDIIEIWYHTFEFSDIQLYNAYCNAMIPPMVTTDCVTQDHLMLQGAIDLLEGALISDTIGDFAMIRDDQTVYDPSGGAGILRERGRVIERLRKQLDGLIKECIRSCMLGLEGVLLD